MYQNRSQYENTQGLKTVFLSVKNQPAWVVARHGWSSRNTLLPYMDYTCQIWSLLVRQDGIGVHSVPKNGSAGALTPWVRAWPWKYTPPLHGLPRQSCSLVSSGIGIHPSTWVPHFKVTQGQQKRYSSIQYLLLLLEVHSNCKPIWCCFLDKRTGWA